jgi:hypothetical protein
MRNYPTDKYDKEELQRLNCAPWQVELLRLNPSYCHWGPHEDYMIKDGSGWDSAQSRDSWEQFDFGLDDLNECVNFYFTLSRDSKECPVCAGNCYHPDAQWISESFYGHSTPFRRQTLGELQSAAVMAQFGGERTRMVAGFPSSEVLERYGREFREFCDEMKRGDGEWHDKITKDEYEALKESKRTRKGQNNAADVNRDNVRTGIDGHDGINRCILIETRCKRLGVPLHCEECEGHGYVYTAPVGHVGLVLWILHPRKGCSRGVEIKRIEQSELPAVFEYLRKAAARNATRFSKLPA